MKFDSPLFDRIRVKPSEDRRLQADGPCCDWPHCAQSATHRAPKGRGREREYWRFCLDHVREYNHSYNFFAGMERRRRRPLSKRCPHRVICRHGRSAWSAARAAPQVAQRADRRSRLSEVASAPMIPFDIMRDFGGPRRRAHIPRRGRAAHHPQCRTQGASFTRTGGGRRASRHQGAVQGARQTPSSRFNGGDRGSEEKLREIIEVAIIISRRPVSADLAGLDCKSAYRQHVGFGRGLSEGIGRSKISLYFQDHTDRPSMAAARLRGFGSCLFSVRRDDARSAGDAFAPHRLSVKLAATYDRYHASPLPPRRVSRRRNSNVFDLGVVRGARPMPRPGGPVAFPPGSKGPAHARRSNDRRF